LKVCDVVNIFDLGSPEFGVARIKRYVQTGLLGAGTGLFALIGHLAYLHSTGNFHTVLADEVYRAAQVSAAQIAEHESESGIRSILNLRGASLGEAWYDEELATSAALGIVHADFRMSASIQISPDEAAALIALMREMPKPLLIHCRHGSDRTGLAAALYLAAIAGKREAEAEGQLSLRYGHFAIPYLSDAYPMDEAWEQLEPILGYEES
jgi:protein tyrosine/serine phosphatase